MTKAKILIVEDNGIVALDLENRLKALGYFVSAIVSGGWEAIKKTEEHQPDLVLMDIVLTGKMDGIETAQIIRSRFDRPVIFLTAYADDQRLERAKLTVPFGYILKPYQDRDLKVAIEMALYLAKIDAERRQVKSALQASEQKYRLLLNNLPSIVYKGYKDWSVEFFDEKIERLTGYASEEFNFGRIKWIDIIAKEDHKAARETFIRALKTDKTYAREYRIKSKSGAIKWIQERGQIVIGRRGEIEYISGVFFDITEKMQMEETLRRNEKELRTIAENVPGLFAYIDADGCYRFVNKRYEEWFGIPRQEFLGKHYRQILEKAVFEAIMQPVEAVLSGRRVRYEDLLPLANGASRWAFFEYVPDFDTRGKIKGLFLLATDITKRKQSEEALKESRQKLRNLSSQLIKAQEKERKRISLELHDEMGQALTAIDLNLMEIEEELPSDFASQIRERLADMHTTIERASEKINKLSLDLRPSMLDDLGLVPTLRWYCNKTTQRSKMEVTLQVIGPDIRLDSDIETVLYRIAQEALNNSIKYANAKRVSVLLEHKQQSIGLCITDDGKGFDVKTTLKEYHKGRIGLIGMQERASIIGGSLDIQSRRGHGTRILVEIPLRIDD